MQFSISTKIHHQLILFNCSHLCFKIACCLSSYYCSIIIPHTKIRSSGTFLPPKFLKNSFESFFLILLASCSYIGSRIKSTSTFILQIFQGGIQILSVWPSWQILCMWKYPFTGLICSLFSSAKVRDWYVDSFRDIRSFPEVRSREDELAFTQMIKMIRVRHTNVVPAIALGVQQLKKDLGGPKAFPPGIDEIHQFLDRFYMSRIGIRMLIG